MSVSTIQASVLNGIKDLQTVTRNLASPSADELQISIRATGLCGSDLHYFQHYRNGDILIREPLSLGHESAGVVEAVGGGAPHSSSGDFQVGDRVAIEVGIPCDACGRCQEGRYNICKEMKFRSSAKSFPHFQGTLQERINHPARWCHKLPPSVSLEEGALLEPLSVAMHAVRRAQLVPGCTCLVLGAGAVGLLTAALLRVKGAGHITIADIVERRVDFAVANMFADRGVVLPRKNAGPTVEERMADAREAAALLGKDTDTLVQNGDRHPPAKQFDVVFECTGVEPCLQTAIYAAREGGKVLLIGMGTPVQTLPVSAAALREVDLIGVFRYTATYKEGIELIAAANEGKSLPGSPPQARPLPDLKKLITHRVEGLENVRAAFEIAGRPVDDDGKLVLKVLVQ